MSRTSLILVVTSIVLAGGAASASGQVEVYGYSGSTLAYGSDCAALGDADGDLVPDFAVTDGAACSAVSGSGQVLVYSGATGQVIQVFSPPTIGLTADCLVEGVGDVNGDGRTDIGFQPLPAGTPMEVRDVMSGGLLTSITSSGGVRRLGDVDDDGLDDLAFVSSFYAQITVYSATGTLLYSISPPPGTTGAFAESFDRVDDLNQDGKPDMIVGAPDSYWIFGAPGQVYVFSGADGSLMHTLVGPGTQARFGIAVAGMDDVDGDAVPDFGVFAPGAPGIGQLNPSGGVGQVIFYSGATAQEIAAYDCPPGQACGNPSLPSALAAGWGLEGVGDVDGDGSGDVLVRGIWTNPAGNATVISGRTGTKLLGIPILQQNFGFHFESLGDLDGDDIVEVVTSDPGVFNPPFFDYNGYAKVYSLRTPGVSYFGDPCASPQSELLRMGTRGKPAEGATLTVNVSKVPDGVPAALLVGSSTTLWGGLPLPLDLGFVGAPACSLLVAPEALHCVATTAFGPQAAFASASWSFPNGLPLGGIVLHAQWFVFHPPGSPTIGSVTRGMTVAFQ